MALDAIDLEAMKQGSAISRIRNLIGTTRRSFKRPPRTAVATVPNKDRWGNRGKSLKK